MKLEAISMVRVLPPAGADLGEGVTRQTLRDAGIGSWSAACGHVDDVHALDQPEDPPAKTTNPLCDYDEVLPFAEGAPAPKERVITLRFGTGG